MAMSGGTLFSRGGFYLSIAFGTDRRFRFTGNPICNNEGCHSSENFVAAACLKTTLDPTSIAVWRPPSKDYILKYFGHQNAHAALPTSCEGVHVKVAHTPGGANDKRAHYVVIGPFPLGNTEALVREALRALSLGGNNTDVEEALRMREAVLGDLAGLGVPEGRITMHNLTADGRTEVGGLKDDEDDEDDNDSDNDDENYE